MTAPDPTRTLRAVRVSEPQDPEVLYIEDFLTLAEAQHLMSLAEPRWRESTVGRGYAQDIMKDAEFKNQASKNRTSYSAELDCAMDDIVLAVEERVAAASGFPRAHVERLNLVRYSPGQYFNEHHDGGFRPKTVFIYLNDLEEGCEGGETYFPYLGLRILPKAGAALVWPNVTPDGELDLNMRHAGVAPSKGVKYAVNAFVNQSPINAAPSLAPSNPLVGVPASA